ncbi:MAG: hypothetical protein AB7S26_24035 [Sandaracinaceae bacterium]
MRAPSSRWLLSVALAAGCSLPFSGIGDRVVDAGPRPRVDAGPATDGASVCAPSEQRCDGEVAIRCAADGRVEAIDCAAMMQRCVAVDGAPHCEAACTPRGTSHCVTGGAVTCGSDGVETFTPCETCVSGMCVTPQPCYDADVDVGRVQFDLCGEGDDETFVPVGTDCGDTRRVDGEDVVVRFEVGARGDYDFRLSDLPDARHVDPVLYIRSACDPASQVACADDTVGSPNFFPAIRTTLDPGTYYVVLDSFLVGAVCGRVELSITPR